MVQVCMRLKPRVIIKGFENAPHHRRSLASEAIKLRYMAGSRSRAVQCAEYHNSRINALVARVGSKVYIQNLIQHYRIRSLGAPYVSLQRHNHSPGTYTSPLNPRNSLCLNACRRSHPTVTRDFDGCLGCGVSLRSF